MMMTRRPRARPGSIADYGARWAALLVLLALLPVCVRAQQAQPITLPAVYSSDTMTRNADLSLAAAIAATGALDRAIAAAWSPEPRSRASRATRIAKLAAFDLPVVLFAVGLNHEGGHIARAREGGFPYTFEIVGSPWSTRSFELIGLTPGIFDDMGSQAGGFEASRRLKDRGEALLWHTDRVSSGHALTTIVAALDLPVYAWQSLAEDRVARPGDPARVLAILAVDRRAGLDEFNALRSSMRWRANLNFADTALWTLAYGVIRDHLWRGERGVRVRWLRIRGVQLLPGVRYEWTPAGPEYSVRSHYRTGRAAGLGYVRWSEHLAGARQVGFGGSLSWRAYAPVRPGLDIDAWSNTRDGVGAHVAASLEVGRLAPGPSSLLLSAGAKSRGHMGSLPADAGAYVSAGALVRFW